MVLALHQTDAVRSTLRSLFDYAGLFPPAACSMEEACAAYGRARRSPSEWMLGTFVVPLTRVDALVAERRRATDGHTWPVSVLVGAASSETLLELDAARARWSGVLTLGALEVGPLEPEGIRAVAERLPSDVQVFFETPVDDLLEARLDAVAAAGACAKIRTGGVSVDAFPGVADVARFVFACKHRELPFKATAGLHHALRGLQPVTYEADAPRAVMHGFLDLAVGALLVDAGRIERSELEELLAAETLGDFELGERAVAWRGRRVKLDDIERSRRSFFCSIGSCSFDEPVADLEELGVLETPPVDGPRVVPSK